MDRRRHKTPKALLPWGFQFWADPSGPSEEVGDSRHGPVACTPLGSTEPPSRVIGPRLTVPFYRPSSPVYYLGNSFPEIIPRHFSRFANLLSRVCIDLLDFSIHSPNPACGPYQPTSWGCYYGLSVIKSNTNWTNRGFWRAAEYAAPKYTALVFIIVGHLKNSKFREAFSELPFSARR